jgi:hypothetical protein
MTAPMIPWVTKWNFFVSSKTQNTKMHFYIDKKLKKITI